MKTCLQPEGCDSHSFCLNNIFPSFWLVALLSLLLSLFQYPHPSLSFITVSSSDRSALLGGSLLSRDWHALPGRQPWKWKPRREREREEERERERKTERYWTIFRMNECWWGSKEQKWKTQRSHVFRLALSLASTFQHVCVWPWELLVFCVCVCVCGCRYNV